MRPASGATYIANSLGPSDDPCGTPVSTVFQSGVLPLHLTNDRL